MTRSERTLQAIYVSLVTVLTCVVFYVSTTHGEKLLSDGLVTRTATPHDNTTSASSHDPGSMAANNHQSTAHQPMTGMLEIGPGHGHPLDPALRLARDALSRFQSTVDDYTATMIKRERVGGSLGGETRMAIKVRTRKMDGDKLVRPLQVYILMLDPWLARGREVIWIENKNEGKLIAHEGGLKNLVRVNLAPSDSLAMMGNKYPITEIGLAKLIEKLIEKGERDKQVGPCDVKIEDGFEVGGVACRRIQVTHTNIDPRFDFHIAQIFLDPERMIPLRYAAWRWPPKAGDAPVLEEEYTYTDVRLNVGLTDADFDPENPKYKFP